MVGHKIINKDVLDALEEIPDNSIHAIITSPPYFTGKSYEDSKDGDIVSKWRAYADWLIEVFLRCERVLVPGGHLWINIDDSHTSLKSSVKANTVLPTHAELTVALAPVYHYKALILWRKIRTYHASGGSQRMLGSYGRFGSPGSIPIVQEVEYILWFKKKGKRTDLTDDLRRRSALQPYEFKEYGMQVWNVRPLLGADRLGHDAPFPPEIPERCIKLGTFVGDTVLDIFSGTGSTGVAAMRNERNYIGIERSTEWAEASAYRLSTMQYNFLGTEREG